MGGSRALSCLRLATRATLKIHGRAGFVAGELSRGVGLRGFESHSPHHKRTHDIFRDVLSNITFSGRILVMAHNLLTPK